MLNYLGFFFDYSICLLTFIPIWRTYLLVYHSINSTVFTQVCRQWIDGKKWEFKCAEKNENDVG